jgi:hypothetical protein
MQLPGARGQQERDLTLGGAGTITAGGTAQLLLPEAKSRSLFIFSNLSSGNLLLEFGSARAHAVLTGTAVTSIVIDNAGFNFTYPPSVDLIGGGNSNNTAYLGVADVGYPAPGDPAYVYPRTTDLSGQRPARAGIPVLSAGAVSSIPVADGGAGYQIAPLVFIKNSMRDPFGCAIPSATSGILIVAGGGSFYVNGPACMTDSIAVFGATTGQQFYYKYMP